MPNRGGRGGITGNYCHPGNKFPLCWLLCWSLRLLRTPCMVLVIVVLIGVGARKTSKVDFGYNTSMMICI